MWVAVSNRHEREDQSDPEFPFLPMRTQDIIDEKLIAEKANNSEGQKAARDAESKERNETIEMSGGGNHDDLGVD